MAYTASHNTGTAGGKIAAGMTGFAGVIETLVTRAARYRLYRKTLRELSDVSAQDLRDLGLSRANLRAAAYQAVYGAHD